MRDEDLDALLQAEFQADAPPARDPFFNAAIMQKVARRRFQIELALRFVIGAALFLACLVSAPVFNDLIAAPPAELSLLGAVLSLAGLTAFLALRPGALLSMPRRISSRRR